MQRRAELSAVIGEHTFIERIKFNRSGLTRFQRRMNIQAVYSKAVRFILGTFKTGRGCKVFCVQAIIALP